MATTDETPASREKRSRRALRAGLAAIDALSVGRPLALALAEAMRAEGELGPAERRAAATMSRAVARELRRIDLALARAAERVQFKLKAVAAADRALLRYLALRVSVEGEPPRRSLDELRLPGPRRPRAIDDAALARVAGALEPVEALPAPPEPVAAVALRRSVPDFLAQALAADFGVERADAVLAALNAPARLDLRANRLLTTREALRERLAAEGVETAPCALAPDGLIAADRAHLFGKAHAEGLFEVQDEGSQLIAALCGARPGERAIDYCAGSGGKTLALAAAVGRADEDGGTGRVMACDAVERRLAELPARARRAHANRIIEIAGAAPPDDLEPVDVVLVDAPCSGIGSMRREPDLRWRLKPSALDEYPVRQLEILERAARHVRVGGRLVYATCSPLKREDEEVVARFLGGHPEFAKLPLEACLPASIAAQVDSGEGYLRVWPDRHGGGAFFAALMTRAG